MPKNRAKHIQSSSVVGSVPHPNTTADNTSNKPVSDVSESVTDQSGPTSQVIFDERRSLFMDNLLNTCKNEQVGLAIAIVCDPKIQEGPLVVIEGHKYEAASLLAFLLRKLKADINRDLDV